ncbi:MAG: hydrolase [Pseudomonas fluorescens]|nr:MAG: hydrolase [Pseudomonas fluorescens]
MNLHPHVWLPLEGASRTVVALHGTGGDEHDLVPLVRQLYPEVNILGIRGNVREGASNRFFRRFAEGMFDMEDLKVQSADLLAFWDAAKAEYGLVDAQTTWFGYSNGANMIAALLLQGEVVRDAVLLRAMDVGLKPLGKGDATVLMLNGEYDPIVPVASAAAVRDSLLEKGYEVTATQLPTGHQLSHMDFDILMNGAK